MAGESYRMNKARLSVCSASKIPLSLPMPQQLASIEFSLDDTIGGQPLTPENVDLPTLRGFIEEVEKLVKGDVPGASLAESRVRIETGSVRLVVLAGQMLVSNLNADMVRLETSGDLDLIQPKRAEVIELWQRRAQRQPTRSYRVRDASNAGAKPLTVKSISHYQHAGENAWVLVEKYLAGKVVDLGGKQDPNVHLVLTDTGKSIRVSATEQQLAAETENQLYKEVTLRVQAEQHLKTRDLRNVRLLEFLHRTDEVDEAALSRLWSRGSEAWRGIPSATAWVESMRGV
jgi:hypothetical protein